MFCCISDVITPTLPPGLVFDSVKVVFGVCSVAMDGVSELFDELTGPKLVSMYFGRSVEFRATSSFKLSQEDLRSGSSFGSTVGVVLSDGCTESMKIGVSGVVGSSVVPESFFSLLLSSSFEEDLRCNPDVSADASAETAS
jgi:hypothetical protein